METPIIYASEPERAGKSAVGLCAAGYYALLLLDGKADASGFGRRYCDFQDGTLLCLSPQSAAAFAPAIASGPVERMLAFDPARFRCMALDRTVAGYAFFDYLPSEMLHLSASERRTIIRCMEDIRLEAGRKEDHLSCRVLSQQIALLLDYCVRFYERQFITRSLLSQSLLSRYEARITRWIEQGALQTPGLPPERTCADALGLSAAYFRSLLRFETGGTHTDYVQTRRIETARRMLSAGTLPVCEISARLGFPSVECFSRFFRKITGCLPEEYGPAN